MATAASAGATAEALAVVTGELFDRSDALFAELKRGLLPLVSAIRASAVAAQPQLFRGFPVESQRAFLREVTERLGFNYRRGRIDVSLHPFCSGTGADIRMTTRFDADNPLDSLFSSIHETGHGLYEQGLPLTQLGTALGQAVGMAIHESLTVMSSTAPLRNTADKPACRSLQLESTMRAAFSNRTLPVLYGGGVSFERPGGKMRYLPSSLKSEPRTSRPEMTISVTGTPKAPRKVTAAVLVAATMEPGERSDAGS